MKRLGKNHGRYHGETIDIRATLEQITAAGQTHGWKPEVFHESDGFQWQALHRHSSLVTRHSSRLYLSTGIHGDEPAGPLAALRLLRENQWPEDLEIFLLPCLNPLGFMVNKRENSAGLDLNRDYRNSKAAETRAHIAWLERQPKFDLFLCLHEDWESHGFYLYEQNPDCRASLADAMIQAVQPICPIDLNENIEGRPAQGGIIRPKINPLERPDWPEALYLISHKSRQGYTLEAPSDFELNVRVNALVAATTTAVKALATDGHG